VRTGCKHIGIRVQKGRPTGPHPRRAQVCARQRDLGLGVCGAARRQGLLRGASVPVVTARVGRGRFRTDHTCRGLTAVVERAGHTNPTTGARLTRDPPWDVKSSAGASMPAAAEVAATAPAEEAAAEAAERKVPPPPPPDKGKEEAKHPDANDAAGKMAKDAAAAGTSCHGSCV
jgi:hypothetical protein